MVGFLPAAIRVSRLVADAAERKGKKAEPPAPQPVVKAAEEPPKERPRSGKKDVLGEFLHTWTL
jgi:hypothetical protein